jgi:hypothetical protein
MRPTDVCHPNELRVPAPRAFPAHFAAFTAWTPHGVLGSVRHDRGIGCFTTPEPLRRIDIEHAEPRAFDLTASSHERGRSLPTAPDAIEPLTPLSPLPLVLALTRLRACGRVATCWGACSGRRVKEPPRPRSTPLRGKRCLTMTRGAFHRGGPFVESGDDYSPGSATAPYLAVNDATAGWRSHATLGLLPVLVR